jgi:hypothetical protein
VDNYDVHFDLCSAILFVGGVHKKIDDAAGEYD